MLVIEIRQTDVFAKWLSRLRDLGARQRIVVRIRRLSLGNAGDARPVGEGVSEMRIDHGAGYRVYYLSRGESLVLLLCGGDKGAQKQDIAAAKALARKWKA